MQLRTVLIAALIGSATAVSAAPAHAGPPATSMLVTAAGQPDAVLAQARTEARVDAFFRDYRQAVLRRGGRPRAVRVKYLTARLNKRLDHWAERHGADPVFHARKVPGQWSVRYEGTAAGYSTVVLTERWGSGAARELVFQVRLPDLRIMDLEDPA
ncbi:hypothetical protein [Streptomyces silvisoli]|uniref:Uncharacterized protein n=1 Tax=Streptomyces silvisoli TaxID=3034235 RepID=A0ABT5ZDS8_9ACTN|nr:hypothetical protein [Streptomyces silvisoli]MDF3287967.1 hypothetical protein [Streptomyces silvisoli]